ncbi:Uncharacterised protein [Vibrio cholerae]|nr:Uncharacterised protein [Vibrio cholerae]
MHRHWLVDATFTTRFTTTRTRIALLVIVTRGHLSLIRFCRATTSTFFVEVSLIFRFACITRSRYMVICVFLHITYSLFISRPTLTIFFSQFAYFFKLTATFLFGLTSCFFFLATF